MEKGRLVRSLAVTHMGISSSLNQGNNCPQRGEARATEDTKKVVLLMRLRGEWTEFQDYTQVTAFGALKIFNLNLPYAGQSVEDFTYVPLLTL